MLVKTILGRHSYSLSTLLVEVILISQQPFRSLSRGNALSLGPRLLTAAN